MIIRATLLTLIILLVAVVASSYYVNKEGFENISKAYYDNLTKNIGNAVNTVPADTPEPSATATAGPSATTTTTATSEPSEDQSSTPKRTDVMPEVTISGSGYDAMSLQQRMDLLKDIQKAVRNELLASRNTTAVDDKDDYYKSRDTDSTAQGREYSRGTYKQSECDTTQKPDENNGCPPMPDMSQYIRKDAIPCWGCTLDY